MSKNSFVQFFGYGGYKKPTPNRNATSRASFKGSIYYLKYYMRFTVKIRYENSGTLEEDDDSYAFGIRNVKIIFTFILMQIKEKLFTKLLFLILKAKQ